MTEKAKVTIEISGQKQTLNMDSAIIFGINEIGCGKFENCTAFTGQKIEQSIFYNLFASLTVGLCKRLFKDHIVAGFQIHGIAEELNELVDKEILEKVSEEELRNALLLGPEEFKKKMLGEEH